MRKAKCGLEVFVGILIVLFFCSCIPPHPDPVSFPVDVENEAITDASFEADLNFWRDVTLEYYRDGQMIYMEWGKVFANKREDGRILIYSPDRGEMDTRAYRFKDACLESDDDYSMEALFGSVLLRGWVFEKSEETEPATIVVRARPQDEEDLELKREPDFEEVAFFLNLFTLFFEIWINIIID